MIYSGDYIRARRKALKLTQEELARKIGVSRNTVKNYETGGVIPESKKEILRNVLAEGASNAPIFIPDAKHAYVTDYLEVPLVPVSAQAGYLVGFGDQEYVENLPLVPVFVDKNYKGKYMVFEVSGDSMDDGSREALCDGDKILCREIKRELWTSKLHIRDWYFVIVCKTEGITVKQITNHDVETGVITCHPLNPLFEDFNVHLDNVVELYNVIKIVDRSTRL